MSSRLASVPVAKRKRLAATLGLFAVLFVAIAVLSALGHGTAAPVFCGVAAAVAAFLTLLAWGVLETVRADRAEARFRETAGRIVGGHGCGCGHDHDADELHVTSGGQPVGSEPGGSGGPTPSAAASCPRDSSGADCAHDCDACSLVAARPAQSRPPTGT